jgi:hypothetical protein
MYAMISHQVGVEKVENVDIKRAAIFSFLGGALVGPTLHFWLVLPYICIIMGLIEILDRFVVLGLRKVFLSS